MSTSQMDPTPPPLPASADHALAEWLVDTADAVLTELRTSGLEGTALQDAGDGTSHERLMLAENPPDDAVLSEGQGRPSPRSTAPRSTASPS